MERVSQPSEKTGDAIQEIFLTPDERKRIEEVVNEYIDSYGDNPEKVIAFLRKNKNYLWELSSQLQNAYKEEGKEKGNTMPFHLLEKIIEKLL